MKGFGILFSPLTQLEGLPYTPILTFQAPWGIRKHENIETGERRLSTMEKRCESCGLDYVSEEGWAECPDCGKVYCPRCSDDMRKEKRTIEKLREGDAYTRLRILCPSCSIEMLH
jgi:predicted RNA-binding Zn-ribbon protein involved in translation (DUF1610 family)